MYWKRCNTHLSDKASWQALRSCSVRWSWTKSFKASGT